MGLYHQGYSEAMAKVDAMTESECLAILDALFGRNNLEYGDGIEELRAEVRRQYTREFQNRDDPGWDAVEFFTRIHRSRFLED
jgi:hypothetical protein